MANNNTDSGKYWPYMIIGFIFIGLLLGFWTVRSAISMPVNEDDTFQKKYQDADININDILVKQQKFDAKYKIEPVGLEISDFKPKIGAHKKSKFYALKDKMVFVYKITDLSGNVVDDANVSFLLTRPQTNKENQKFDTLKIVNGAYTTPEITIQNPGRYILRFKAKIKDIEGYLETEAYKKP